VVDAIVLQRPLQEVADERLGGEVRPRHGSNEQCATANVKRKMSGNGRKVPAAVLPSELRQERFLKM
jgi:hypothetical protein